MNAPQPLDFLADAETRAARFAATKYTRACEAAERHEPALSRALAAMGRAGYTSAVSAAVLYMAAAEEALGSVPIDEVARDAICDLRCIVKDVAAGLDRGGLL